MPKETPFPSFFLGDHFFSFLFFGYATWRQIASVSRGRCVATTRLHTSFPGRTSVRSLPGGIEPIWETPCKERVQPVHRPLFCPRVGSTWSANRLRETDKATCTNNDSASADVSVMQPTARPKPARAPRLVPTHSIANLHSPLRAVTSSTPAADACAPHSSQPPPTLVTGKS